MTKQAMAAITDGTVCARCQDAPCVCDELDGIDYYTTTDPDALSSEED